MASAGAGGYTTRILKGAALVPYTKELLREWDDARSIDENLLGFRRSGTFGRSSARRASQILEVLRRRYLDDDEVRRGLVRIARTRPEPPTLELILGYHAAISDPLLFDFAADCLYPALRRGTVTVTVDEAVRFLDERRLLAGPAAWSSRTSLEVARKLLTAWRDFGILRGGARKELVRPQVPLVTFVWVATHRARSIPSASSLVEDRAFRLLLLSPGDVESLLVAASSRRLLDYHGGGPVGRVDWRYAALEDLAVVIA